MEENRVYGLWMVVSRILIDGTVMKPRKSFEVGRRLDHVQGQIYESTDWAIRGMIGC